MCKYELTREILDENQIRIEFDSDNQPIVIQQYIKNIRNRSKDWNTNRTILEENVEHPYGKPYKAKLVNVKINGKSQTFVLSNLVWVYFFGKIPKGYDIDHINEDPLDNRLDNLQLLTRKENLAKRGHSVNQYTANLSKEEREEIYKQNQLKKQKKTDRYTAKLLKERMKDRLDEVLFIRDYYQLLLEEAKDECVKKWLRERIDALTQEKKAINKLLRTPIKNIA